MTQMNFLSTDERIALAESDLMSAPNSIFEECRHEQKDGRWAVTLLFRGLLTEASQDLLRAIGVKISDDPVFTVHETKDDGRKLQLVTYAKTESKGEYSGPFIVLLLHRVKITASQIQIQKTP